jgi:hypothetical protein
MENDMTEHFFVSVMEGVHYMVVVSLGCWGLYETFMSLWQTRDYPRAAFGTGLIVLASIAAA